MSITRRHVLLGLPLALSLAGGAGFYALLRRMQDGDYDPHSLPSPLIGKPPPAFTLPGVVGLPGVSALDLRSLTAPILVNWFASWCAPCQQEAQILQQLHAQGVTIWGIAYEDSPTAITRFLQTYGTPYQRLGLDKTGLTAINWGVYGVPESYVIDKTGIVRWRYAGPLTDAVVNDHLMPMLKGVA